MKNNNNILWLICFTLLLCIDNAFAIEEENTLGTPVCGLYSFIFSWTYWSIGFAIGIIGWLTGHNKIANIIIFSMIFFALFLAAAYALLFVMVVLTAVMGTAFKSKK
jgi:hypothetical protein